MVISSVIGSSFQHILTSPLQPPPPPPSSSTSTAFPAPLSSTKLRAIRNSEFATAVTTLTTATSTLDGAHRSERTESSPNNLASVFRRATQSAIREIQESSDLESSLSRLLIIFVIIF